MPSWLTRNAALKKLKEDGTYDIIMQKYFNYDIKIYRLREA